MPGRLLVQHHFPTRGKRSVLNNFMTRRTVSALAVIIPFTLLTAACGSENKDPDGVEPTNPTTARRGYPLDPIKKGMTIAFVPKQLGGSLYF